jgi:uncharacterized membrane protein
MSKKKRNPSQKNPSIKSESANVTQKDKRSAKKAAVLGTNTKKRPPVYALLSIGILIVACGIYFYVSRSSTNAVESAVSVQNTGSEIIYPVGLFDDGNARHYEYKTDGITVKYFIIKSSDGVIRAAFDACDVCWPAGKGYVQSGDVMVCRNCGRKFASVLVNEVKGGCNPAPLTRTVENGTLIIRVKDILTGKPYFNFSGKV